MHWDGGLVFSRRRQAPLQPLRVVSRGNIAPSDRACVKPRGSPLNDVSLATDYEETQCPDGRHRNGRRRERVCVNRSRLQVSDLLETSLNFVTCP